MVRLGLNLGYSSTDTELITCDLAGNMRVKYTTKPNISSYNNQQTGSLNYPFKLRVPTAAVFLAEPLTDIEV